MLYGTEGYRPYVCDVEKDGPPSSYAVAAVLDRQPGAVPRLFGLTVLRALFIAPALYVSSRLVARDLALWQIAMMAMGASSGITTGMVVWYKIQRHFKPERTLPSLDGWRHPV